jgi:hypothetical protein
MSEKYLLIDLGKESRQAAGRLKQEERRLLVELLDREIYDLADRLNPDQEGYVGQSQHDYAEERLAYAIEARDKISRGLPERINPLHLVIRGTRPAIRSAKLKARLVE